jgi:hypothetical protein
MESFHQAVHNEVFVDVSASLLKSDDSENKKKIRVQSQKTDPFEEMIKKAKANLEEVNMGLQTKML